MKKTLFFLVIFILTFITGNFLFTEKVHAVQRELTGWAWSSNIGWISFNCSNPTLLTCGDVPYKVQVDDASGVLTGYAWSSNIGWISFNATTGCPAGLCTPRYILGTGYRNVIGWIRACSATITKDCQGTLASDWDGWIKLSGFNHTSPNSAGTGGVTYNASNGSFIGYAWGGDVVGWVTFNATVGAPVTCPTCGVTATCDFNVLPVNGNTNLNMNWTINNDAGATYDLKRNGVTIASNVNHSYTQYVDTVTFGTPYTYTLVRSVSGGATCPSHAVTVTSGVSSAVGKLWLGNNQNTVQVNMDTDDFVDVRWSVDPSLSCQAIQTSGSNINDWLGNPISEEAPGVQRLRNLLEGNYTLDLSCTDPEGLDVPINSVNLIVTQSVLEEI